MHYVLTGFTQEMGFRVFEFDQIQDHKRVAYTVRADLALSRKYSIPMQELPLLCRRLLEGRGESEQQRAFTFTEQAMSDHASDCAARSAFKKHPRIGHKPPPAGA